MTMLFRRSALAASIALLSINLSVHAAAKAEIAIPDIPYTKFVLKNGLTVLVHEDHKTPVVAVNTWYHVGSKNEKPGKTGFAHLFEHLMFSGSDNFNHTYLQAMERIGATGLNGTTNTDRTNYFQNVPTSMLDDLLFAESDRMGHLLGVLDQKKLDLQRAVVQTPRGQTQADALLDLSAKILGGGKTARFYKRLVYKDQLATGADAAQSTAEIGSQFYVVLNARPGADMRKEAALGHPESLKLPAMQKATLSNGLKVVLAERHAAPVVNLSMLVDAGYASATPDQAGLDCRSV
jgi:predicted Zn-dependent peptidase